MIEYSVIIFVFMLGRSNVKKFLSVITAAALVGGLLCSCGKPKTDENISIPIRTNGGINYETVHAVVGTLKDEVSIEGSFTTPYRVELMFTHMGGTIAAINVHEDQEVEEGEVIAVLSGDDLEEDITVQKIKLDSAQSTYDALVGSHASAEDIEFARIALEIEQTEYDNLTDKRQYLELKAPFAGRITSMNGYWVGAHIDQNSPFCTISDSSKVMLTARDRMGQLSNISFGTKVEIKQGSILETTGKVVDTVTSESGGWEMWGGNGGFGGFGGDGGPTTVTSYIIQPDEDLDFLEIGGIEVIFTTLRRDDAVIVPSEAIFEATDDLTNQTAQFVNVLMNGIKVQTQVEVGAVNSEGFAEIVNGLDGSETLILR